MVFSVVVFVFPLLLSQSATSKKNCTIGWMALVETNTSLLVDVHQSVVSSRVFPMIFCWTDMVAVGAKKQMSATKPL